MGLIDYLIEQGWLKSERIIAAFRTIKRIDFLPEEMKNLSEMNEALPIGLGQTISQPSVVAFMLEELQPEPGEKVLDVGSGSGWTSALLAEIVGPKGKIFSLELVPELKDLGQRNASKYGFIEKGISEFICTDGSKGYVKDAPYDKILSSAAADKIPDFWKEQVKINGRIVAPINNSIVVCNKIQPASGKIEFEEKEYPGFVFVPLLSL
ncbi:MAG: protein-L-isoaspartate O-methyltransferase [Parcubacteria group bacterium]|nr:MAG: protein-L-isoaspartate O-methyltransferase [Parcubacteria group bacterium]